MTASLIAVNVSIRDQMTPALQKVGEAMARFYWSLWWAQWGTNGYRRQTALVLYKGS